MHPPEDLTAGQGEEMRQRRPLLRQHQFRHLYVGQSHFVNPGMREYQTYQIIRPPHEGRQKIQEPEGKQPISIDDKQHHWNRYLASPYDLVLLQYGNEVLVHDQRFARGRFSQDQAMQGEGSRIVLAHRQSQRQGNSLEAP